MPKTQIRIAPLMSNKKQGEKYSLVKSINHNFRVKKSESHIDYNINNQYFFSQNADEFIKRLDLIKKKYPMLSKKSNIDVVESVFTVNSDYFYNDEEKQKKFLDAVRDFLKTQLYENNEDYILNIAVHRDEASYHIHTYHVPIYSSRYKNRYGESKKICINFKHYYGESFNERQHKKEKKEKCKLELLQDTWHSIAFKYLPDLERGTSKNITKAKNLSPQEFREFKNKTNNIQKEIKSYEDVLKNYNKLLVELNKDIEKQEKKYNEIIKKIGIITHLTEQEIAEYIQKKYKNIKNKNLEYVHDMQKLPTL